MKVEKITKLKNSKYKIKLDNEEIFITYDDVILNNGLLFHKEMDNDKYLKLKNDIAYYDIYYSIIKYVSKRVRSEKEIRLYLEKKTFDNYLIEEILNKLKEIGLINDRNFAKAYIHDKLNLSNIGINKIKKDLLDYGIDEAIIKEEIGKVDNHLSTNKLEKLILKKIKSNHKYSNNILKQKIIVSMVDLGYDKENVVSICDMYMQDDNDILKKEYDNLYSKLSLRYEGKELEYKVKQKLYSKGFSLDEINKIIANQ